MANERIEQHAATVREARKYIARAQMGSVAVEQVLTRWDAALDELVALAGRADEHHAEEMRYLTRGCTGKSDCQASLHKHGCLSDFGQCDEPFEHANRFAGTHPRGGVE